MIVVDQLVILEADNEFPKQNNIFIKSFFYVIYKHILCCNDEKIPKSKILEICSPRPISNSSTLNKSVQTLYPSKSRIWTCNNDKSLSI